MFLTFFSILIIFHVFLVKVLNIILSNKIRNLTYFIRKNLKVELHSSNILFWWLSSNFAIFSCKMSVTFESKVTAPMCIRIGSVHKTVPLFWQQEAPSQSQFTELHLRAESVI